MGNKRIYLGRSTGKYALIAGGSLATITSLFFVLMYLGIQIAGSNDVCLGTPNDPCVSYGSICNYGPDNYDIYNPDGVKMDFSPTLQNYWMFFKDGRVKKEMLYDVGVNASTRGWRYENFTNATRPVSSALYVHRFARYSCQDYMLVGLKNNPNDVIKWGVGVGSEYLDPFWYGVGNDTANIAVSNNITLELGSQVNLTMNVAGATTVCVDIDHPEYGNNYACGSPNANFLFNISYFQKTEFNDSSTSYEFNDTFYTLNETAYFGAYGMLPPYEYCTPLYIENEVPQRLKVTYYAYNFTTASPPIINIRDSNQVLLETLDNSDFANSQYSDAMSNELYVSGLYGFCIKALNDSTGTKFFRNAIGTPWIIEGGSIDKTPHMIVSSQDNIVYISSHKYDEALNLTFNISAVDFSRNVRIYINDTEVKYLGYVYNSTSGNISSVNKTSLDLRSTNSTFFVIPKNANVTSTKLNFTGGNFTWHISSYTTPITATGEHGIASPITPDLVQTWYYPFDNIYLGFQGNPGVGPWISGSVYWDVEWDAIIYENYTRDGLALIGNWSALYDCGSHPDISFDIDCWNGGSWVEVVSDSGTSCPGTNYNNAKTFKLSTLCTSQSTLQIKNTLRYGVEGYGTVKRAVYYGGKVNYYRYGFPENLTIEVGTPNGVLEYDGFGELTGSNSTSSFASAVNTFLAGCSADSDNNCNVPIYFSSDDGGNISIDNIEILYTVNLNPITINSSVIQNYLDNSPQGTVNVPFSFWIGSGKINVSDLKYNHAGGNDTISIFAYDNGTVGLSLATFNNSLTTENISFSSSSNVTRHLSLPLLTNVTTSTINLSGNHIICYQETANVSTSCGGLSTGTYGFSGYFETNPAGRQYAYDGVWTSWIDLYTNSTVTNISINYSIPAGTTGSLWQIKVLNLTGGFNPYISNTTIPDGCLNNPLQLKLSFNVPTLSVEGWCKNSTGLQKIYSFLTTDGTFYEEAIFWNITLSNPSLIVNNTRAWNYTGLFNSSVSPNRTNDLSAIINSALNNGKCDCVGCKISGANCTINFTFHSDSTGKLTYNAIDIDYYIMPNRSKNDTMNIINYYSNWNYSFPAHINWLEFIPNGPTSDNVTPYGQSSSKPIFNVTNYGYGGKNSLFYTYLNETYSCVDLFLSTNSVKPSSSLWTGLIGYWSFDIDTKDMSGSNDGEIINSVPDDSGKVGGAYNFNGINQSIELGNDTILNSLNNTHTITAWIKLDSIQNFTRIVDKGYPRLSIGSTNRAYYQIRSDGFPTGSGPHYIYGTTQLTNLSKWYFIAGTYNGSDIKIYVDGILEGTDNNNDTGGTSNPTSASFYVGSSGATSGFFNGSIDEVRIYNRTLTPAEISELYNRSNNNYFDLKLKNEWQITNWDSEYLDNIGLWMWADYECNYTTWKLWEPELSFRNCCVDCICSEDLS